MNNVTAKTLHPTVILFILISLFSASNAHAYCNSSGNSYYEWISNVTVGDFSYSSAGSGYSDNTNQRIDLSKGTYNINLVPGFRGSTYTENWGAWIDFNQDGVFSADEEVFNGVSSQSLSGTITIPDTALGGTTKMRISMQWNTTAQPCGIFAYGEVEDYTVFINSVDTTIDNTPPSIISYTPGFNALDIAPSTSIIINYSEVIDPQTVNNSNVRVFYAGGEVPATINTNGDVVTITPTQPLEFSTQYFVTVQAVIQDLAGNTLSNGQTWYFTTSDPDTTPPEITQPSPQNGSTDVVINFPISAHFSEVMDPATINSSTFIVTDGVSNISGTVSLSDFGLTAVFNPTQPFEYSTNYTATILSAVKDAAGNSLVSDYSWSFTTREYQPTYCSSYANNTYYMWISSVKVRTFTSSTPSQPYSGYSDYTGTVFNLSRYSENSVALTPGYSSYAYPSYWRIFIDWNHDGVFTNDEIAFSGNTTSILNGNFTVPENALSGNTRMRVSMQYANYPSACGVISYGKVHDYRVNVPDAYVDTSPPTVTSVSPINGAQNILISSSISVTFSEELSPETLTESSLVLTGGTTPVTFTMSYDAPTSTATFTPTTDLEYGTSYSATLSGNIADVAGNTMVNSDIWSFSTQSEPIPTYLISGEVTNLGVGLGSTTITISGDATFTTTTDGSGVYSLAIPAGQYTITASNSGYTFSPESLGLTVTNSDIYSVNFSATALPNVLTNGDFEQATFNGFTPYTTTSGVITNYIDSFDTNNDGISSYAATFSVGIVDANSVGTHQGGGIYQIVGLNSGSLSASVDIASYSGTYNGSGGMVQILFDGVVMDSHDFGSMAAGIAEYATLSFDIGSITSGNHEVRIQITRPYMQSYVRNYVDNIVLSGTSTQ